MDLLSVVNLVVGLVLTLVHIPTRELGSMDLMDLHITCHRGIILLTTLPLVENTTIHILHVDRPRLTMNMVRLVLLPQVDTTIRRGLQPEPNLVLVQIMVCMHLLYRLIAMNICNVSYQADFISCSGNVCVRCSLVTSSYMG